MLCDLCYVIYAMHAMLCNLCNAIYAMQSMLCNLCYAINAMPKMAQNGAKMRQNATKVAENCVKKATSNSSCFGRRFFVEFALLWHTPEPRNCSSRMGGVHISQFSLLLLQSIIFASFALTLRSLWDNFGITFGIRGAL